MKSFNYNGIINDLTKGLWKSPATNKIISIPIKKIEILPSIDGKEIEFIQKTHPCEKILLISDEITYDILGKRIFNNLIKKINVSEYIWKEPICSIEGVQHIQEVSKDFSVLIAIGSGTINDTVKYASFLDNKKYSVFATSPMNAYTTPTASVLFDGFKKSLGAHAATGVYFDLSILSKCPKKLRAAAFADVICRTTAQVDWLMSNMILNTQYDETPYILLGLYEDEMIKKAKKIKEGEISSLALLTRISAIMGLGTFFTGTTHLGSMAEHGISHYIDMFANSLHPGTSHGEQVGIATLTVSKIQNSILNNDKAPTMHPTTIPKNDIIKILGESTIDLIKQQMKVKSFNSKKIDALNNYLENNYPKNCHKVFV